MKIISYILLIKLFLITDSYAQKNLIANGNFELSKSVPTKDGDFSKVVNWFNPSVDFDDNFNYGTPDYFHLNGKGEAKIPYTKMGTVFANSGKACVGLISYTDHDKGINDFREYIAIELEEDLEIGKEYTLNISYTNGSDSQYGFYQTKKLGIGFSKNKPIQTGYQPLKVDFVIELENLKYELDWVKKEITFISNGNFKYLIIGNFEKDLHTSVIKSEIANSNSKFAYIFLDDIDLIEVKKALEDDSITDVREDIPIQMDTIKIIKEVIKEVPVEIIQERVDTIEVIREVIKEVPLEIIKERVDTIEVIREIIKEVPIEIIKERVDTIEVIREIIKEVPVEIIKERVDTVQIIQEVKVYKEANEDFTGSLLKGKTLILDIHFEANSFQIKERHHFELNKVENFLKEHSDIVVEISGHTNSLPSDKYCDDLSSERANSVKKYLISKGISSEQILAKGYGKRKPIASNITRVERRKNQRVEIKLINTYRH